jgi:quercetin dioxygenase-like cupin family protein
VRALVSLAAASLALGGCAGGPVGTIPTFQPAAGVNEVLTGPIAGAPGRSLVMGDLVLAPNGEIARHFHAGEEFLYVLGGSAVVSRHGEQDVILLPGQGIRIAPGTVHWGRAGPEGVRAIASWVAVEGQPLRTPVPQ